MRLPSVSLACAVWVLCHLPAAAVPEARAASHGPTLVTSCMDLSEPKTMDFIAPPAREDLLPSAARPWPVPTPLDARRLAHGESYEDVFEILRGENECSRFFGGPARAVEAFNEFASRLHSRNLGTPTVAVRMTGTYTRYRNGETGATFRIFERAMINRDGPFGPRPPSAPRMQVGRFQAYTPQARALVLLHELGHLVEGKSGEWLLPNDGDDAALSERNTRRVEAHCFEQLKAIRD
jgi:hypothetical protein